MSQTFKTATKFTGLQTYPNSLSEVQPGALQLANNVVIDRPGTVTPRRGQRAYSTLAGPNRNILTQDQATCTHFTQTTAAFNTAAAYTYNSTGQGSTLTSVASPAYAGQRALSITSKFIGGGLNFNGAGIVLHGLDPTGPLYTFSCWAYCTTTDNISLYVVDQGNVALNNNVTLLQANTWTQISITFAQTVGLTDAQVTMGYQNTSYKTFFVDQLQLELGATPTAWQLPNTLVPTRLFQVDNALYGMFTGDGLPSSQGTLNRIVAGSPVSAAGLPILPPPGNAVHSFQTKNNAYFSTNDGMQKLLPVLTGNTSGTTVPAGMPYALDTQASLLAPLAGTLGFLKGGSATAYRVVWGNTDPQGNLTLGAPSPAVVVANPVLTAKAAIYTPVTVPSISPVYPNVAYFVYVNLPWTASANQALRGVSVVQGKSVSTGDLYVTSGSNVAAVLLTDVVHYFGPVNTPVSIVLRSNIVSVSGTTLNLTPGFVQTGWDPGHVPAPSPVLIAYQPVISSDPSNTTIAAASSAIVTAPNTSQITVAGGSFVAGPVGLLASCTINTAQLPQLFTKHSGTTYADPAANDSLTLPGISTNLVVVSSIINTPLDVGAIYSGDVVNLASFPEGLLLMGDASVSVYRPSNTTVSFTVPKEAYLYTAASTGQASTVFYQVYRSATQQQILPGVATTPTDNMQQCYQGYITGTSGATSISFNDIAPDATLGAALYTSPQQGGILSSQYQPPVASDTALYQNTALYANVYLPATLSLQLLGVSATNVVGLAALQPGDVIQISNAYLPVQFTAVASGATGTQFNISTGSGSITTDINNTVANLCRTINVAYLQPLNATTGAATETVSCLSTSSATSMGGTFTMQTSRGLGQFSIAFIPNVSYAHASPFSGLTSNVQLTVAPTQQQNALYYSPQGQPEAVPLLNSLTVGPANYPIQRIAVLPSSVIIFKPEAIYQLVGNSPAQFNISVLNTTAQLLSNESAVSLQSAVLAFTTQGVLTISPGGEQIVSLAINDELLALTQLPAFASTSFGVAHESERRYLLFSPTLSTDTLPTQAYVYNILTNAWSKWQMPRVCGLVNSADQLLYTGSANYGAVNGLRNVYQEANAGGDFNYGDEIASGTLTVNSPTSATLTGLPAQGGYNVPSSFATSGACLVTPTGAGYPTSIVAASSTSVTLTFASTATLANGPATLYQATPVSFAPVPIGGDDADSVKQFQEFVLYLVNTTCPTVTAQAQSDFGVDNTVLPMTVFGQPTQPGIGFGAGPWGNIPWGSGPTAANIQPHPARQLVPLKAARGHVFWPTFNAQVAANFFSAQGLTLGWTLQRTLRSK